MMHPAERKIRQDDPNLGKTSGTACLYSWINTLSNSYVRGEGCTLSQDAVTTLLHTLIDARIRIEG